MEKRNFDVFGSSEATVEFIIRPRFKFFLLRTLHSALRTSSPSRADSRLLHHRAIERGDGDHRPACSSRAGAVREAAGPVQSRAGSCPASPGAGPGRTRTRTGHGACRISAGAFQTWV